MRPTAGHRPADLGDWVRGLGHRRPRLRLRLGRPGRQRLGRRHPPGRRCRHQLDRHGGHLRARPLGAGRRPRPEGTRAAPSPVRVHEGLARLGQRRPDLPLAQGRVAAARKWTTACGGSRSTRSTSTSFTGRSRSGSRACAPTSRRAGATLADLQKAGKIRHIAVSNFNVGRDGARAGHRAHRQPAAALFDDPPRHRGRDPPLLPAAPDRRHRLFADGGRHPDGRDDAGARAVAAGERLALEAPGAARSRSSRAISRWWRSCGGSAPRTARSPGAVAIAWALRHPAVTAAIVGFRSPAQIEAPLRRPTSRSPTPSFAPSTHSWPSDRIGRPQTGTAAIAELLHFFSIVLASPTATA